MKFSYQRYFPHKTLLFELEILLHHQIISAWKAQFSLLSVFVVLHFDCAMSQHIESLDCCVLLKNDLSSVVHGCLNRLHDGNHFFESPQMKRLERHDVLTDLVLAIAKKLRVSVGDVLY